MPEDVREVIKRHHASYEVMPYYVVVEEGPHGPTATSRRVHAGFDVDVYGVRTSREPGPSHDYIVAYEALERLVGTISPHTTEGCTIEIITFGSTFILDAKRQFEEEAVLRIRITHARGLDQPAGAPEERALKEVEEQLQSAGVSPRSGRE